jgi:hypothetical protein
METEIILGVVMVSPLVFSAVALRWGSEAWLYAFVILARCLGRVM